MPLKDYRLVYDLLNYDNSDCIDFQKFCLINIDKASSIKMLIEDTRKNKDYQKELIHRKEDEDYYNNRFRSSLYPGEKPDLS